MYDFNHIGLPGLAVFVVVLFFCFKYKIIPLAMTVQDDDTDNDKDKDKDKDKDADKDKNKSTEKVDKSEYDKVKTELDKIKAETEKKEKAEKEKTGKFEDLYKQSEAEKEKLKEFETKYTELEKETRDSLMEQLSDEDKIIAADLGISKLRAYVKVHGKDAASVETDGSKATGGKISVSGKKYDDFTMIERNVLAEKQPADYKKLYKEKFGFEPAL